MLLHNGRNDTVQNTDSFVENMGAKSRDLGLECLEEGRNEIL